MHTRLQKIREAMGLSKRDMGKLLGLSDSGYGLLESGRRDSISKYIDTIIDKTGVRREYLETGEEPMFMDDLTRAILTEFKMLSPEEQSVVVHLIETFSKKNKPE